MAKGRGHGREFRSEHVHRLEQRPHAITRSWRSHPDAIRRPDHALAGRDRRGRRCAAPLASARTGGHGARGAAGADDRGQSRTLESGEAYIIPGNATHSARAVNGTCKVIDVFSPVREDYAKGVNRVHERLNEPANPRTREARGRSAEPYVAPQNRLDPHTSAFRRRPHQLCQYPPSLKLRRTSPKPAAEAGTPYGFAPDIRSRAAVAREGLHGEPVNPRTREPDSAHTSSRPMLTMKY